MQRATEETQDILRGVLSSLRPEGEMMKGSVRAMGSTLQEKLDDLEYAIRRLHSDALDLEGRVGVHELKPSKPQLTSVAVGMSRLS